MPALEKLHRTINSSCGKNHIYDGTFSHQLVEGDGIFVQMLKEKGIAVYSENEVTEVLKLINGGK